MSHESRMAQHAQLCDGLKALTAQKNAAYGDSFHQTVEEFGPSSLIIRLSDKYIRIKTLLTNPDIDAGDEAITDTLRDLANYCLLAITELTELAELQKPPVKKAPAKRRAPRTTTPEVIPNVDEPSQDE